MYITAVENGDRKIFDGPGDAIKQGVLDRQISRVARLGKVLISQRRAAVRLDPHRRSGPVPVLHRARIHPSRLAGGLSPAEARRLHAAIQAILRAAVDSGGTSFAGYVNEARGHPGYLGQAHVFRRQGLPCDVCGTPIVRTTVAGRATNFCPHCQQR